MTDPKALAARLRAMHATQRWHFTPPVESGKPQIFSVLATAERFGDLLLAADALEKAESVRPLDDPRLQELRTAAQAELAKWQAAGHNAGAATTAILALCERLGVTL